MTDEYELMIGTAERLGVSVAVTGTLPQTEINKHILATPSMSALQTFFATLAGRAGVKITETETHIAAELIGNGVPPGGEIVEKGGLVSLRALTERAGGTMTVRSVPIFSITLELPKEVENGL